MKRNIRLYMLTQFLAYITFTANIACILNSCDSDDNVSQDRSEYPDYVSRETFEALYHLYPGAQNVEWNMKGDYRIAKFSLPVSRATEMYNNKAWFDNKGNWYMTQSEMLFDLLPDPVKKTFNTSEYAEWHVTDVDQLLRGKTDIIYIVEVESNQNGRKVEMDLYYSEDGVLVKKVLDMDDDYDYNDYILSQPTEKINGFIKQRYPGARIIEIDKENGMTEIEIIDGKKCRELLFDSSDKWIHTKTEMLYDELPGEVKTAYSSSQYSDYRIDDIDFYETQSGNFYRFDLKSINGDIKIEIKEDGTISAGHNPSEPNYGEEPENGNMADKTIKDFIQEKYPNTFIVEFEYEDGMIKVEIIHENKEKDIYFNGAKKWVISKWDLLRNELPEIVNSIINSKYPNYKLDDVEYVQTPSEEYYLVELEQGEQEIKLRINKNGNIL